MLKLAANKYPACDGFMCLGIRTSGGLCELLDSIKCASALFAAEGSRCSMDPSLCSDCSAVWKQFHISETYIAFLFRVAHAAKRLYRFLAWPPSFACVWQGAGVPISASVLGDCASSIAVTGPGTDLGCLVFHWVFLPLWCASFARSFPTAKLAYCPTHCNTSHLTSVSLTSVRWNASSIFHCLTNMRSNNEGSVRFEVITAVTMKNAVFWDIKKTVRSSQETHYVSVTEASLLMLCRIWGFHGGGYEECRLLGYKTPVRTSQGTNNVSATESSRLILCKIWGFHSGGYEECHFLGCDTMWFF
jgi:hypothetical protein